jgi:NitT/TauT family transport system substrate-binding protein
MRNALRLATLALIGLLLFGSSGAGAQAPVVIHVGISSFEAHADVYYAVELGLFKKADLDVDIQQYQGGAAIVAAIAGGALQIGGGNPLPLAIARQRGVKVLIIAPGYLYDTASSPPIEALAVAASSPYRTAKDLNGKTIGATALNGLDQVGIFSWIEANGGDYRSVRLVEVPQGAMPDALSVGRVEAAQIGDPALSSGIDSGKVRIIGKSFDAIAKRFFAAVWFASDDWAAQNPVAIRKYTNAINEASAWAVRNPEQAALVLQKYMHVTFSRAHEYHARTLDPKLLQPILDAAVKYKLLNPMRAEEIIWHPPQ